MDTKKLYFFAMAIILAGGVAALTVNQDVIVKVIPGIITIYSPIQDHIYDSRMILINLTMSEKADVLYARDGDKLIKICRNCMEYSKKKPFDDGFHILDIEGSFELGNVIEQINFTVDSKKPNIKKTSPNKGYANGDFYVEFDEVNPNELLLHYGEDTINIDMSQSCELKKKKYYCNVEIDLTAYDGQEIEYWWALEDILGRIDESRKRTLRIDMTSPTLTVNMPKNSEIYDKKVPFNISVSEKSIIEYLDDHSNWKKLCSNCESYGVDKIKTRGFREGNYDITIRATDKAGNFDEKTISVSVI